MSNLIKLKQIESGKKLQTDVAANATAIETLNTTVADNAAAIEELSESVADQINAAKSEVYTIETDSVVLSEIVAGLPEDTIVKAGDILVAVNSLGVRSAYAYDVEDGWVACDGNVDANSVILSQDITLAGDYTQVGTLTKTKNGTATFSTSGKSVQQALIEMLSATLQPKITANPAVTVSGLSTGAVEVGTTITPSYTATLSAGSYTYGPATGITATSWSITDTEGNSSTSSSGSFDSITIEDDTSYRITATATYNAGAIADDNLGNDSNPVVQIAAGSKTGYSSYITGFRPYFYGVLSTSSTEAPLTSAIIREQLTNGGNYNGSVSFTLNGSSTAKRIVIAIPATSNRSGLSEVILTSAMNTPITDQYIKTEDAVQVEGLNGYKAAYYDVWVYEPSKIDAGEVHAITLA